MLLRCLFENNNWCHLQNFNARVLVQQVGVLIVYVLSICHQSVMWFFKIHNTDYIMAVNADCIPTLYMWCIKIAYLVIHVCTHKYVLLLAFTEDYASVFVPIPHSIFGSPSLLSVSDFFFVVQIPVYLHIVYTKFKSTMYM